MEMGLTAVAIAAALCVVTGVQLSGRPSRRRSIVTATDARRQSVVVSRMYSRHAPRLTDTTHIDVAPLVKLKARISGGRNCDDVTGTLQWPAGRGVYPQTTKEHSPFLHPFLYSLPSPFSFTLFPFCRFVSGEEAFP